MARIDVTTVLQTSQPRPCLGARQDREGRDLLSPDDLVKRSARVCAKVLHKRFETTTPSLRELGV